uniref:Uncharacterized protein n=1 Tax=Rhizophora mucronata TaxID=61149 RepID=A0A2P2N5Q9_RHIMU
MLCLLNFWETMCCFLLKFFSDNAKSDALVE